VLLGVGWTSSEDLIRTAASLAAALDGHLICAFVDPASYLTEWEPAGFRAARSLDPVLNEEAEFPSGHLRQKIEGILGQPGYTWSFRVLNGDVAKALTRLAGATGAALIVVGTGKPGPLAWLDRALEGSVAANLLRQQHRPVLVVPEPGSRRRS
jgi:nucleotide-binding universal stress UspA family protein